VISQLHGCRHLFSCDHIRVEIQASCAMMVCMLILIYTGEKPTRTMEPTVRWDLIDSSVRRRGVGSPERRGGP
jgi:hypothetical protein